MAEIKGLRINEQIRVREVRLIDENNEQKGIVPTIEALKMAKERDFDLVEVAPNANPPVCKILDYGKYRFEQEKKLRDSKILSGIYYAFLFLFMFCVYKDIKEG